MSNADSAPGEEATDPLGYDPAEALALLEASRQTVVVGQQLDLGPWWYVTVLGFAPIGVITWFRGGFGLVGAAIGVVAIVATAALLLHDRRRRGVQLSLGIPAQTDRPGLLAMFTLNVVLIFGWNMTSGWVQDQPIDVFILAMFALWLFTVAVLTAFRVFLHDRRKKVMGQ